MSNHARPGAESRHNLLYWRSGDWAGIGPGAHGRLTLDGTRHATEAPRDPGTWLASVESGAGGELPRSPLTDRERLEEMLLMGLRLGEGLPLDRLTPLGFGALGGNVTELAAMGVLETTPDRIAVTPAGRPLLDAVLRRLVA